MEIKDKEELVRRSTGVLWGQAGCGKTTFLASLPGKILYIMIDPDGKESIPEWCDYAVLDMSFMSDQETVDSLYKKVPTLIEKLGDEFKSVVVDSLTVYAERALNLAVAKGVGSGKGGFQPSIEEPGQTAYGARRQYIVQATANILRATARRGFNCWFTTHQADAERDQKGNILGYTMMLGGKATNDVGIKISESWWMREADGKRFIAVRNCRMREPMKTRLFDATNSPEFQLKFDPSLGPEQPHSLTTWHNKWIEGGRKKLPLPT